MRLENRQQVRTEVLSNPLLARTQLSKTHWAIATSFSEGLSLAYSVLGMAVEVKDSVRREKVPRIPKDLADKLC